MGVNPTGMPVIASICLPHLAPYGVATHLNRSQELFGMNRHPLVRANYLLLLLLVVSANGQVSPQIIVDPDQFTFTSASYFSTSGATNALVTVQFFPGTPCWCGQINYTSQDGTAVAGKDYTQVSGTLAFDGNSTRSISIPIKPNTTDQQEKTITLVLNVSPGDANAIITPRHQAILYLNVPPPPSLQITRTPNKTLAISWADDGTGPYLERLQDVSVGKWTAVGTWRTSSNGWMTVVDTSSMGSAFYRLKRAQ